MIVESFSIYKQRGVALIQVLLITTIISLLAIHFSYTARDQVSIAASVDQRVRANQELVTAQNQVIYYLLTQSSSDTTSAGSSESIAWNYYGKPFLLSSADNLRVYISLQDVNGLLSQRYFGSSHWAKVLANMGYSAGEISRVQGVVEDWQDKNNDSWKIGSIEPETLASGKGYRNQAIQLPEEIDWLFEGKSIELSIIKQISTPYAVVGFNPMRAPDELISLFFTPSVANQIIRNRENNILTRAQMRNFLGRDYNDVIINLLDGSQFKITVYVELEEARMQETIEVIVQPLEVEPLLILARY